MENSLSSICFRGSIPEAISEAKMQRKLFVVYISGDDDESIRMKSSTWNVQNVSDSVSKYCILLHLSEGSTDAVNFSKIYASAKLVSPFPCINCTDPQNSVPSITSVGYNGVKLWQHEGFVNAEDLVSALEKAYFSLHIQETTASMLSAALASSTSESPASQASTAVTSVEQGSSSSASQVAPLSSSGLNQASEVTPSEKVEEKRDREAIIKSKDTDQSALRSNSPPELDNVAKKESTSNKPPAKSSSAPESIDSGSKKFTSVSRESNLSTEKKPNPVEETVENRPSSSNPNEVHLNIRLPNGTSLQEKFLVANTLRMVKDFVDKDHSSEIGPYDLATPYPRKVFNDLDLSKSLSELELLGRQALVVVPRGGRRGYSEGASMSRASVDDSDANNEGYVVFARRLLSYLNPFSYLSRGQGSPSLVQDSADGMLRHRSNTDTGANVSRSYSQDPRNQASSSGSEIRSRWPTTTRYGSNIHTLKHDEDDDPRFSDKNAYWNGNSTEYGGGDNDSK